MAKVLPLCNQRSESLPPADMADMKDKPKAKLLPFSKR
jgi:hypothetical protein